MSRLAFLKTVAVETGTLVLPGMGKAEGVAKTADPFDIATEYDRKAEAHVRARIAEVYGDEPIFGEENGLEGDPERARHGVWVVDPIDGTLNYERGLPLFAVSLAWCVDRVPVVGVTYLPVMRHLFYAAAGEGAFLEDLGSGTPPVRLAPAHATEPVIDITGPKTYALFQACEEEGINRHVLRYMRCSAPSLAWVASGALDACIHTGLWPWDCAAGHVLLQEVGGVGPLALDGTPIFPTYLDRWLDGSHRRAFPCQAATHAALIQEPLARILRRAGL